jgi:hypothetical protein
MSEGDIEILGGRVGQSAFRAVLGKQPYTRSAMLAAMDTVIGDQNCAEVGGDVQYGEFMGTQFRVFGFIRQSMKGPDLAISYRVRGFDLNVELERLHQLGLHPRYPFVQGPDLPDDVVDQEVRKYLFSLT